MTGHTVIPVRFTATERRMIGFLNAATRGPVGVFLVAFVLVCFVASSYVHPLVNGPIFVLIALLPAAFTIEVASDPATVGKWGVAGWVVARLLQFAVAVAVGTLIVYAVGYAAAYMLTPHGKMTEGSLEYYVTTFDLVRGVDYLSSEYGGATTGRLYGAGEKNVQNQLEETLAAVCYAYMVLVGVTCAFLIGAQAKKEVEREYN